MRSELYMKAFKSNLNRDSVLKAPGYFIGVIGLATTITGFYYGSEILAILGVTLVGWGFIFIMFGNILISTLLKR